MILQLKPARIAAVLCIIVFLLTVGHVLSGLYVYYSGVSVIPWGVALFHFDHEGNLPSFYSAVTLLFAGLLLLVIAFAERIGSQFRYWLGLGVLFIFVAVDEAVMIHEQLMPVLRDAFGFSGLFFFAWVIPYGIGLLALAFVYAKFIFNLPARIRNLFIISAGIFIFGAVVLELFEGAQMEAAGARTILYQALMSCEELLEMIGVIVFTYALTDYIATFLPDLQIRFGYGQAAADPQSTSVPEHSADS